MSPSCLFVPENKGSYLAFSLVSWIKGKKNYRKQTKSRKQPRREKSQHWQRWHILSVCDLIIGFECFSGLISDSYHSWNSDLNEPHKADCDSGNASVRLSQMEQVLRYRRENLTLSPSHSSVRGHAERLQIGFVVWLCGGSQQEKVMNKTSQRLSPQDWHTLVHPYAVDGARYYSCWFGG